MTVSPYLIIFCHAVHSDDHLMSDVLLLPMNGTMDDMDSLLHC